MYVDDDKPFKQPTDTRTYITSNRKKTLVEINIYNGEAEDIPDRRIIEIKINVHSILIN